MHAQPHPIPEEQSVPPGDDSDDEPTHPLPADPAPGAPERNPAVGTATRDVPHAPRKEEFEIGRERDMRSDGRDPEGEPKVDDLEKPSVPSDKPERQ